MFKSNMETTAFLSKHPVLKGGGHHINFIVKKFQFQSDQKFNVCIHAVCLTVHVSDIKYEKCCFIGCWGPPPLTAV